MPTYPAYTWDAALKRYRSDASGRLVAQSEIRAALDRALRAESLRARALAVDLSQGSITLREFDVGMREVIKNTQIFSSAAAQGGWGQMDARAYGQIGQSVREQYGYLNQLRDELRAGLGKDGSFIRRSESYAEAGRRLYHDVERDQMLEAGKNEERCRTTPGAESCNECLAEEAAGWRTIGVMTPIGQRECLNGCQCRVEYRTNTEAGVPSAASIIPLRQSVSLGQQRVAVPPSPTRRDEQRVAAARAGEPAAVSSSVTARAGATETITRFTRDDGTWLPERQQEHDRIKQQFLSGVRPVKNPTVRMLGGGPASGKSVMLKEVPENWAHVDPDAVKESLPEWAPAVARGDTTIAAVVHEESSYLAKNIVKEALDNRYNVIVDGTGDSSYDNLASKVASYRRSGVEVVAEYVTVDIDTAIQRAALRGARTGRFVPETVMREVHKNVSIVVPQAIENGLFDRFVLWDTNGSKAVKVAEGVGRRLTILDQAAWQRFLAKAND